MNQIVDEHFNIYQIPDSERVSIGRGDLCDVRVNRSILDPLHFCYFPRTNVLQIIADAEADVSYYIIDGENSKARIESISPGERGRITIRTEKQDELVFVKIGEGEEEVVLTFQNKYIPPQIHSTRSLEECLGEFSSAAT